MTTINDTQGDFTDLLIRLTGQLCRIEDLDHCLDLVAGAAMKAVPAVGASLRLFDTRRESFVSAARAGEGVHKPLTRLRAGEGVIGWVAKHARVALVPDTRLDDRFVERKEQLRSIRSLVCAPVISWGEVIGVLGVTNSKENQFDEESARRVQLLANLAVLPLEIHRLKQMCLTDPLTGAFNRRYFDRRLDEEIRRALRYHYPLILALLDLDDFTNVNEEHGHLVGDQLLQQVADLFAYSLRAHDVISRWGGDEFVILMPQTDRESAHVVLERLIANAAKIEISTSSVDGEPKAVVSVTVSAGVVLHRRGMHPNDLIEQAGAALSRAKETGGNKVVGA